MSQSRNPIHQIIDSLSEFCERLEVCHQADTSATRRESLQAWRSLKYSFLTKHRFPNEAFRALCDPALAWLTNHGFHDQHFVQTINEGVAITVHLVRHRPIAMPDVYANKEEASQHWEQQLQMFVAAWAVEDRRRAVAAQTGHVWMAEVGERTVGLASPHAAQGPRVEKGAKSAAKPESESATTIVDKSHPDGPEAPYWL
jgi:hypothetical protein